MRKEKQLLLDEIKDKMDASKAFLVASYVKLHPNMSWDFRLLLSKSHSEFEVVKKRLFIKAAALSNIHIDEEVLAGHIGVIFVNQEDAMAAAKALVKFSKDHDSFCKLLYGQMNGKLLPGAEVEELSNLPTLDEMRAILLGLFTSPMSQLLSVIEAIMSGPLSVIEKKTEQ